MPTANWARIPQTTIIQHVHCTMYIIFIWTHRMKGTRMSNEHCTITCIDDKCHRPHVHTSIPILQVSYSEKLSEMVKWMEGRQYYVNPCIHGAILTANKILIFISSLVVCRSLLVIFSIFTDRRLSTRAIINYHRRMHFSMVSLMAFRIHILCIMYISIKKYEPSSSKCHLVHA